MNVAAFLQPDSTVQDAPTYKVAIDASVKVMSQIGGAFAPHAAATPNMTVKVDAGSMLVNGALVVWAQQTTSTIVAPISLPRIDRVVMDATTGTISVVAGTENASPVAPAIPPNKIPVCQFPLTPPPTSTTAITNAIIIDERPAIDMTMPNGSVGSAKLAPVPDISGTDTYTVALGFTSWVQGQPFMVHVLNPNATTTPSINPDSQGAKTIVLQDGSAVAAGQVVGPCWFMYDSTSGKVMLLNPKLTVSSADQVARDQIALTNLRQLLNTAVATGPLVQGKQWELLTDEWATSSTGYAYTAPGGIGYYTRGAAGYTNNFVPVMTSNIAPSGLASSSGGAPWNAFDDNASSSCQVATGGGVYIQYDPVTPKIVTKYAVSARPVDAAWQATGWVLKGWDGASWITLDTRTGLAWSAGETKTFTIANTTTYSKYKLDGLTNGVAYTEIAEFAMYESTPAPEATLIPSVAVSVASAPNFMDCIILYKDDGGGAVLGTDITVDLSRNNGTTWAVATITTLASYDGTYSVLKARADVSAQPSGTSMLCRIKTLNNKAQRVAAPALYAE